MNVFFSFFASSHHFKTKFDISFIPVSAWLSIFCSVWLPNFPQFYAIFFNIFNFPYIFALFNFKDSTWLDLTWNTQFQRPNFKYLDSQWIFVTIIVSVSVFLATCICVVWILVLCIKNTAISEYLHGIVFSIHLLKNIKFAKWIIYKVVLSLFPPSLTFSHSFTHARSFSLKKKREKIDDKIG